MCSGKRTKQPLLWLLWLAEGIVVGFGAILPGISGGTLCVAFGMYRPAIETISNIRSGLKKYGIMLCAFTVGVGIGFIGLSGFAAYLLERNTVSVTCVFIGFVFGTMPELWRDAGTQKRTKKSYIALIIGFILMLLILFSLKTQVSVEIPKNFIGFLLCGLLWGLSFIVPGLSSSSLLLFFGLYQPMLEGIYSLDMSVLIPLGIGFILCVLLLSKVVGILYKKHFSLVSHTILGVVAATAIMIIPDFNSSYNQILLNIAFIIGGASISFAFTCICNKLKNREPSYHV